MDTKTDSVKPVPELRILQNFVEDVRIVKTSPAVTIVSPKYHNLDANILADLAGTFFPRSILKCSPIKVIKIGSVASNFIENRNA